MASYEYDGSPCTASQKELLDELEAQGEELFRKLGVADNDTQLAALLGPLVSGDVTDPRVQQQFMETAARIAKSSNGRQILAFIASSWTKILDHAEPESEEEDQARVANEHKESSEKQKCPDIPAMDVNGGSSSDNKCQSQRPDKSGGRGSKKRGKDTADVGESSRSSTIDEPVHDWGRNTNLSLAATAGKQIRKGPHPKVRELQSTASSETKTGSSKTTGQAGVEEMAEKGEESRLKDA